MNWKFHHKPETVSTNEDARGGKHGDVFMADFQSGGKGRLDHVWVSPPGKNLLMSVVLDVSGRTPEEVATIPLVVGLAVVKAVKGKLKWPNDILLKGKKVAGILCERQGDTVIAGIGVNVLEQEFPPEIAARATYMGGTMNVKRLRDLVLNELAWWHGLWKMRGFAAVYPELRLVDILHGKTVSVRQTDNDKAPITGFCQGIAPNGALNVGGKLIFAGEAHVEAVK